MSKNIKEKYLKTIQDNFPDIQFSSAKLIIKWWSNDIIILDNNIISTIDIPQNEKGIDIENRIEVLKKFIKNE